MPKTGFIGPKVLAQAKNLTNTPIKKVLTKTKKPTSQESLRNAEKQLKETIRVTGEQYKAMHGVKVKAKTK